MIIRPNTTISGRYTILEQIGVGGMAVVYKALDQKLNRAVTFKVLKEEFTADAEFIKRFEVEAQAAARLSHSNIVNAYDVGNDGNIYYIVMEYIDGVTLKELINKRAPFDNQEALSVAIQIASALEEAHKNNIVHRDIKPHNILVTKEGVVKVTDFGIARAATSTTVTVESMGSVHYFSPEQARGGFVDAKSDIYSLGIVLFEMVTGRLPFEGDTPVALAMKHLRDPIPDIKSINPDVSQSIEMIILKATQKSSSKRYLSIDDMNRDLKRATNNPTGNFVNFDGEDASSQTIRVTEKELDEIKTQARQMYDDDYDDDYDDYRTSPKNGYAINKHNDGYNKKKERTVVIAAVATAFIIIAAVTFAGSFFLTNEKEVAAPEFVGKTWDEALEIAKENKIYLDKDKNKSEAYSDDIEEGLIMSQNIDEGDMINEGDTVYVVMSLGSDKVKMPDVTNISFDEATNILAADDVNLKWSEKYEYNDEVEKAFIIKQEPEAGELVSRESKVVLYVSKGEESSKAVVPYVVGKSESEAVSMLRTEGFEPKVSYTESEYVNKGKVVSQNVQSGNEMEEGSVIVIYVSKGKSEPETEAKTEPVTEPDEKDETADRNPNADNDENGQDGDQEQNQPEESQEKIEIIVVDPYISEDVESVEVKIVNASDGTVVYSGAHSKSEFPFSKQVKGSTPTVFQLYIDGKFCGEETKFQ